MELYYMKLTNQTQKTVDTNVQKRKRLKRILNIFAPLILDAIFFYIKIFKPNLFNLTIIEVLSHVKASEKS